MEILTRVMAKTVYRIDLLDPPLQYLTRKGKVKKNFEGRARNTSNQQSFSTGWGGLNTQSSGALGRNTSAGANNSPQHLAVKKSSLPRSASEPGIIQKTGKHHLHTLHSDSCVSSSQSMQVHTTVEELIEHQEEDTDSGLENVDNFNDEHFNGNFCGNLSIYHEMALRELLSELFLRKSNTKRAHNLRNILFPTEFSITFLIFSFSQI